MKISENMVVGIYYTLKNDGGEVLDQQVEGEPLLYLHGEGQIVPGLEKMLEGKSVDEALEVKVRPEDGYGKRDKDRILEVERDQIPDAESLEVGMAIVAEGPDGSRIPLWVTEVGAKSVTLDGNHPLAGETLHFAVTIKSIRAATAEELEHGHAHGAGGHHHH